MTENLFPLKKKPLGEDEPLAVRMRPRTKEEFVGQEHLIGPEGVVTGFLQAKKVPSLILYGPPGCGKTALALLITKETGYIFRHLNAVTATVADVREVIQEARQQQNVRGLKTILFLDEIAHFNRLQQDSLMRDVEEGTIVLIGATTHNPFFFLTSPLLSRVQVLELKPLKEGEIQEIIFRAIRDKERGLGRLKISLEGKAIDYLVKMSEGDARRGLNLLETAVLVGRPEPDGVLRLTCSFLEKVGQRKMVRYDRAEDVHYDTISAFIKSMRGSDPDATLYWLARMVAAGEDPRFIARRIVICASEDVGNADPQALVVATCAFQAVALVGMPEARIILAQAALYVATAPKSNSAYRGISEALKEVEKQTTQEVPDHLRSGNYQGARELGRGQGYLYPHDYPGHYVPQSYLPEAKTFYHPTDSGYERKIALFLNHLARLKKENERRTKKPGENSAAVAERKRMAGEKPSDPGKTGL
ncbi:MAG: replication-associated recombination protein A [Candidatus Omnitrophica bacterium]|nr:replication-associated recombination protein A [Candidatus Omnitrophota bacterium]